ncbi:extensin-like domain-containing protein [Chitinasiproducens palmae]|uniref:Extensin-like protein C-terminus n=1 Tax=Chitinasiproducens palmae TaxID=1770053 RepID=A0A1H2PUU8_9BURK|nr:extensin family protein [Chitinasiproducens palmae]SDV50169.1 Extensin-like protein C-terminus [Chitinasiproducens palmae]
MRALLSVLFFVATLLAVMGLTLQLSKYAFERGWLPARYNPFSDLDVRQPPTAVTPFKLWRAANDREYCDRALASADFSVTPLPDRDDDDGCGLHDVYRISRTGTALSSSFMATCELAAAYALFEHHGLQPAAQAVYGQPVRRVEHLGSYACRNINHAASGRRSEHAHANALDLSAFVLADGRRITVSGGWRDNGDAGRFLHQVFDAACEYFHIVLGPEYNALHQNHFHVDMGRFRTCR